MILTNFLAEKMATNKLKRDDKKFIAPHFKGGVVLPSDLLRIASACEKFPESRIKLTGEIVIGGIKQEGRREELRSMLGLPTFSVAGFCVRPIKICSGGFICDNNLQDSFSLGEKLDEKFTGRRLPFKMIISVSGCRRCCSEPLVRDIGVVTSRKGYSIYVGGAAGARPRIAKRLVDDLNANEVADIIGKIISLYEKRGNTFERLGIFVERIGFEKFKESIQIGQTRK